MLAPLLAQLRQRLEREPRTKSAPRLLPYLEHILRALQAHGQAPAPPQMALAVERSAAEAAPVTQPGCTDAPPYHTDAGSATPQLSPRELDILRCIAAGMSNKDIARDLNLTAGTAKWYVAQVYARLGAHSRTQAVARAQALGLLTS